ncbi:uncharacterized protein LOC142326523 [Lycorma delicatula]|uniref:uncharacterized protein LOC142326523 n=1 Tax=Lycorma delicatula TaxID=130591 RepID=UPI003F5180C1
MRAGGGDTEGSQGKQDPQINPLHLLLNGGGNGIGRNNQGLEFLNGVGNNLLGGNNLFDVRSNLLGGTVNPNFSMKDPQINPLQLLLNGGGNGIGRNNQGFDFLNGVTNNNYGLGVGNNLLGGNNLFDVRSNLLGGTANPNFAIPNLNQWEIEAVIRNRELELAKLAKDMDRRKNELLSTYIKGCYRLEIEFEQKKSEIVNDTQNKLLNAQVKVRQNELEKRQRILEIFNPVKP